jgi:abequosyltransferase
MTSARSPVLSICIPTHGRRAGVLANALRSVICQVDDASRDRIEICVSDNAAPDETATTVARLAATAPVHVSYRRNDRDVGLGANIMRAVGLASGEFCWLLGSDDELADDALRHVLGLIDRFPDVSGLCVNWANFDAQLRQRGESDASTYATAPLETRRYDGSDAVLDGVGLMWGYLSANVVRRERWLSAAAAVGDRLAAHPAWPQLLIMGEIARLHPAWVFSPHVVLRNRTASGWMYDLGRRPRDHAKMHVEIVDGIDAVLDELVGRGSPLHRELMTRMFWMVASGRVVSQIKRVQGSSPRSEVALARSLARAFWWLPAFWTSSAPRLLAPGAVAQRRARRRERPAGGPPPLPPGACRTRLRTAAPVAMPTRHVLHVACTLRNTGPADLASTGPHPIRLSYRWFDLAGALVLDGLRAELPRALAPGRCASLTLQLLTPWDEGAYELAVAAVQEHVRWFDDVDPANGVRLSVDVRHPS